MVLLAVWLTTLLIALASLVVVDCARIMPMTAVSTYAVLLWLYILACADALAAVFSRDASALYMDVCTVVFFGSWGALALPYLIQ